MNRHVDRFSERMQGFAHMVDATDPSLAVAGLMPGDENYVQAMCDELGATYQDLTTEKDPLNL